MERTYTPNVPPAPARLGLRYGRTELLTLAMVLINLRRLVDQGWGDSWSQATHR